jgi:multidrug resistance efflux pump
MQVLAYKVAGEEALLAAKRYDVLVQARIMLAKEYAAEVEREQIALQRDRAKMDIKKEEAHLAEVKSRIMLEYYERAQVEVDIAKAQLQVAQANVRAVMAEIAAEEAMLKAVQAELEVAMVDAERATLIADIAGIFADIVVRGLAKIKLAVETAEIEAGFEFIQQKLDDLLVIHKIRGTSKR